jgi:hypothetical protein
LFFFSRPYLSDTANKPKISYKVNKQVDKNGNIIKYDSTYSYIYKGIGGKGFSAINSDSLISNFNSYFNSNPFKLFNENNTLMFNNNLFFNDEFFEKQMELNSNFLPNFLNRKDSTELFYLKNNTTTINKKI